MNQDTHLIQIENYQLFIEPETIVISDGNPSSLEEKFVCITSKEQLKAMVAALLELSFKVEGWKE